MRPSGYSQTSIARSISFRFSGVSSSKYMTLSYCTVSDFVTFRGSRHVSTNSRLSSARKGQCASKSLFGGFAKRALYAAMKAGA